MGEAFKSLSEHVSVAQRTEWGRQEKQASEERGDRLHVFEVDDEKGMSCRAFFKAWTHWFQKAPTIAEIRLELTKTEKKKGMKTGTIAWLTSGMNIEQTQ